MNQTSFCFGCWQQFINQKIFFFSSLTNLFPNASVQNVGFTHQKCTVDVTKLFLGHDAKDVGKSLVLAAQTIKVLILLYVKCKRACNNRLLKNMIL